VGDLGAVRGQMGKYRVLDSGLVSSLVQGLLLCRRQGIWHAFLGVVPAGVPVLPYAARLLVLVILVLWQAGLGHCGLC